MQQKSDSNGGMDGVGKTGETEKAYLHRGRLLWQRAVRETALNPDEVLPTAYLAWLEKLLPTLKPTSRRQYIASSKALLAQMYASEKPSNEGEADLKTAIRKIGGMQSSDYSETVTTRRGRGRTSSQKAKTVNGDDFRILAWASRHMRGKWNKPALRWLGTNILVGLRPSEWRYASLDELEGKVSLVVLNAKNTNGRAHGEKRHLDITGLGFKAVMRIRAQIQSASQHAGDDVAWNAYYTGCRQTIHQLTRKFLSKRKKYPSLYSARHQFAADAKSADMSKVELAALMGHAVDDTAGSHYGKKKHGSGACRVKGDPQEMDKVRIKSPAEPDDTPSMKF